MLYFPNGRVAISQELPVDASSQVNAEGLALVAATIGGVFGAKASTGAAGEKFLGVSVSQQMTIASLARADEAVVPAGLTITLSRTPSAGTLSVYNTTTGAVVPVGAGGWTLAGRVVTFAGGAVAGQEVTAYYKFAPTTTESRSIQGDIFPGGAAGYVVGQVGVLSNGTLYTTEFDTTVNWNATNPTVTLGANGQFTIGGTGTAIQAVVVQAPTAASPFLGLKLQY